MLSDIFLIHPIKSFIRNKRLTVNILSYIIFTFTLIYFIVILFFIGNNLEELLGSEGEDPIMKFNSLILFYLLIDLIIRVVINNRNGLNLVPYLRFPIKRSVIINYILVRNLFNLLNLISLFFIIPFSWKIIYFKYGLIEALNYQIFLPILILINCYIASTLKLIIRKDIVFFSIPIIILISIAIKSVRQTILNISGLLGEQILNSNYFLMITLVTFLVVIILILRYLYSKSFYLEDAFRKSYIEKSSQTHFLSGHYNKSLTFSYFVLELKLLIRNRRTLQTLIIYPFLPVVIIMGIIDGEHNIFLELMFFILILGFFPVLYGQNIFNWESAFFDGKMARESNFTDYLCSKFYLMGFISLIVFIPTIVLFIKHNEYPLLYSSVFLFVNGFINLFVILAGAFNKGRINLNEHYFLNYQGFSTIQLILPVFILIFPVILLKILESIVGLQAMIIICSLAGGFMIIFHKFFIREFIEPLFMKRKYINLDGFRKLYE